MKIVIAFIIIAIIGTTASVVIKNKVSTETMELNEEMTLDNSNNQRQSNTEVNNPSEIENAQEEQNYENNNSIQQTPEEKTTISLDSIVQSNTNQLSANQEEEIKGSTQNDQKVKSTTNNIDIENVRKVLKLAHQYDVIKILRIEKQNQDPAKRVIVSDYFIILSPDNVIKSNNYQTIIIAPVLSEKNYQQSIQKNQFVKIKLKTNEIVYTIPSSLRSIPKLAIVNYYSSISQDSVSRLKQATSSILK